MGKRGPRPEPRTLQIAKGSWRAKLRDGEPLEVSGEMPRPEWLGEIAAAKWDELLPVLIGRGTVSPAYCDFLAQYCQAWQDFHDACKILAEEGPICTSEKGAAYQHPAVGMKHKAIERIGKFGREFGLSPTSIRDIQASTTSGNATDDKERFFA